jgi:single-stranded-DNA-specific exonuclease
MKYRWLLATPQPLLAAQMAAAHGIGLLVAQCLLNRGIGEPEAVAHFLSPRLKQLADPFLLPNMAAAVERLLVALKDAEPVVVFGDYDVDGVTSTALLVEVLRTLGWRVECYLPHRMDEGYGLSRDGVENCLNKFPATLLLAVDCGSTAVETIAWLRQRRVDAIVLDHHQVSSPPPAAVALVNPQLAGADEISFRDLCSVGLAFKLAHALVKRGRDLGLPGMDTFDLRPLLDLVALGTIADVVSLTGENRILVTAGLERLSSTRRPGLVALKQIAQSPEKLNTMDVGYQLAPRLNAAGRLENAQESLQLVLARDEAAALPLARNLDYHNQERQKIERGITTGVIGAVKARFNAQTDFVIVEGQMLWHIGVVGIVASRVLQQFYRPTFILGGEGDNWRGSGRSIAGFDLAAALRECDDLLVRHGGHAMAAGVTILPGNIDRFRQRLNEIARRCLTPEELLPLLRIDAEVGLRELTLDLLGQLDQLKPTGQGNPPLQFCARQLACARPIQRMGAEKQHVKLWVTDGTATHEAVWWGAGSAAMPEGKFDLVFTPQVNDFGGRQTVQLKVLDWRPAA